MQSSLRVVLICPDCGDLRFLWVVGHGCTIPPALVNQGMVFRLSLEEDAGSPEGISVPVYRFAETLESAAQRWGREGHA